MSSGRPDQMPCEVPQTVRTGLLLLESDATGEGGEKKIKVIILNKTSLSNEPLLYNSQFLGLFKTLWAFSGLNTFAIGKRRASLRHINGRYVALPNL